MRTLLTLSSVRRRWQGDEAASFMRHVRRWAKPKPIGVLEEFLERRRASTTTGESVGGAMSRLVFDASEPGTEVDMAVVLFTSCD